MTPDCTIVVRSPAELLAVVPYVLGFHPAHSVVVIGLHGGLVSFGARYDLPPPGHDDTAQIAAVVASQQCRAVVLVGYGPARAVTPTILRLTRALERAEVPICDSLRVTEDRWWSYFCADPRCCPAEGQPCPPEGNPIAAQAVFQGQVALPDRQALADRVAAVTGDARTAMAAATERARARLGARPAPVDSGRAVPSGGGGRAVPSEGGGRAVPPGGGGRAVPPGGGGCALPPDGGGRAVPPEGGEAEPLGGGAVSAGGSHGLVDLAGRWVPRAGRSAVRSAERRHRAGKFLSDDEVAGLGVLLADEAVHDYALSRTDYQEWRVRLWTDVLRRVEPAYVGPPACLLAFTAWQGGEGALARVAVDRALAEAPPHRTVALLDRLLNSGISPHTIAALRSPLGRATGPVPQQSADRPGRTGERLLGRSARRRSS